MSEVPKLSYKYICVYTCRKTHTHRDGALQYNFSSKVVCRETFHSTHSWTHDEHSDLFVQGNLFISLYYLSQVNNILDVTDYYFSVICNWGTALIQRVTTYSYENWCPENFEEHFCWIVRCFCGQGVQICGPAVSRNSGNFSTQVLMINHLGYTHTGFYDIHILV